MCNDTPFVRRASCPAGRASGPFHPEHDNPTLTNRAEGPSCYSLGWSAKRGAPGKLPKIISSPEGAAHPMQSVTALQASQIFISGIPGPALADSLQPRLSYRGLSARSGTCPAYAPGRVTGVLHKPTRATRKIHSAIFRLFPRCGEAFRLFPQRKKFLLLVFHALRRPFGDE